MAAQESAGLTVARILRPQGRRGEVAAEILTSFPERLARMAFANLWDGKTAPRQTGIRSCRLTSSRGGQAIFHFEGSDSISDAEKLVGLEVQIPLSDRMPLPAGSYYVSDLIGCEVCEKAHENAGEKAREKYGPIIGRVRDVQFTGDDIAGTPLLVLDSPRGEWLLPLAQEICVHVDTALRRIEVVLPEGLRDLNP
ncbi:MAG: ribosome maturation factor RimM [Candidatus Acidiferrales bacterium]